MLCVFCSNRANKVEELEAVAQELSQTNVVGNIHLFNLFLPLVLKGKVKKVIAISTGVADIDLTNQLEIENVALYAASKASLNVIVSKFNAQYKKDGVLFLSISPGLVEVGHHVDGTSSSSLLRSLLAPFASRNVSRNNSRLMLSETIATPEQVQGLMAFAGKLTAYAPHFKGPITPEESVKAVRSVWEKASIEGGYGGAFVSHLGNKQWV